MKCQPASTLQTTHTRAQGRLLTLLLIMGLVVAETKTQEDKKCHHQLSHRIMKTTTPTATFTSFRPTQGYVRRTKSRRRHNKENLVLQGLYSRR
ncbi:hypothetical protein BgiBS90_027175 [Biomphalaria glabrata]|nr:hypothetical protein BgiBS90_027175 [Biomphalaria glabrata]